MRGLSGQTRYAVIRTVYLIVRMDTTSEAEMPDGRDAVGAWYTHCTGNPNAVTVQRGDTG